MEKIGNLERKLGPYHPERLTQMNIYRLFERPIREGDLRISADGALERTRPPSIPLDTPWVHTVESPYRGCTLCHRIFFDYCKVLPSRALSCWKVVAMPKTFRDLIAVMEAQYELGRPAKCGTEERPFSKRLYGAYWYNDSYREGAERFEQVRGRLELIDPRMRVILKRGCSEFERKFGRSDEWDKIVTEAHLNWEAKIGEFLPDFEDDEAVTPPPMKARRILHWMIFAAMNGDDTYLDFADEPLPVTPEEREEFSKTVYYKDPAGPLVTYLDTHNVPTAREREEDGGKGR